MAMTGDTASVAVKEMCTNHKLFYSASKNTVRTTQVQHHTCTHEQILLTIMALQLLYQQGSSM